MSVPEVEVYDVNEKPNNTETKIEQSSPNKEIEDLAGISNSSSSSDDNSTEGSGGIETSTDRAEDEVTSTENSVGLEGVDSKNITEVGELAEARISYPFNTGECGKLGRRSAVLQVVIIALILAGFLFNPV